MTTSNEPRFDRLAPLVAGIVLAAPTLVSFYLPMTDLPHHEGMVGLLRHHADPAYCPPGLYRLNLGHPNQLFYLVAWALSYLVGTRWAVKLVIAASQIAIAVYGARMARYLGRSPVGALLLAPLVVGFTYYWGLVTNLVGFAALLAVFPLLDRANDKPSAGGAARSCAAMVLLYACHESVLVLAAAALVAFTLLRPFDVRKTALRLAPSIVAAALVAGQLAMNRPPSPMMKALMGRTVYMPVYDKIVLFGNVLFGAHDAMIRHVLLALELGAIAALVVTRIAAKEPRDNGVRARLLHYRFELFGAGGLVGYFTMPFVANGATLVHERFLGPGWMILCLAAAPKTSPSRIARILATAVPVGVMFVSWPQFVDADRSYRELETLVDRIPVGRGVASIVLEKQATSERVYSEGSFVGRVLAERGGRVSSMFTMSTIAPVLVEDRSSWDEYDARVFMDGPEAIVLGHDLRRFELVVVEARNPVRRALFAAALDPHAELVTYTGEWSLYRSRYPIAPLTAPYEAPPPGAETLGRRMGLLDAELRRVMSAPHPP